MTDPYPDLPVRRPMWRSPINRIVAGMTAISTIFTFIGVGIGAIFLIAGGILLPLYQLADDRDSKKESYA